MHERIIPEDTVTTNYLNTKISYSGTAVSQMSAFKVFIYMLRYVLEEFFDIQAQLESYNIPVYWPIKSLLTKIFLCYCLSVIEFVC